MKKVKRAWVLKTIIKRTSLAPQQKIAIEKQCNEFINSIFKPKAFKQFNSYKNERILVNIYCKWYREFFYIIAVIKDHSPDVIASEYEDKIARLEPKTDTVFYLSYFRHTGEWFDITHGQGFMLKDCLESILDLPHFLPV